MSDIARRHGGWARFNWDKWLVDCAHCTSGLKPGVHIYDDEGVMVRYSVEWGDTSMTCWDCGRVTENIAWPPDPIGIEAILYMRPNEKHRNWWPGETLDMLLLENIAHGILPPIDALEGGGGSLMVTCGERIVGGVMGRLVQQIDPTRQLHEIGH